MHIKIQKFLKNFAFWIVILIFTFCILNFNCYAQPISSKELLENAQEYDGKRIIYQGEIIGEVIERKDSVWLNLLDGDFAIGIFLKKDILPQIKFIGGYKAKGDLLEVEGIFHAHCSEHKGELDIHAEKIRIVKEGFLKEEKISFLRKIWIKYLSLSSFIIFICIILRNFWKRK